jgi:hypothetical protein
MQFSVVCRCNHANNWHFSTAAYITGRTQLLVSWFIDSPLQGKEGMLLLALTLTEPKYISPYVNCYAIYSYIKLIKTLPHQRFQRVRVTLKSGFCDVTWSGTLRAYQHTASIFCHCSQRPSQSQRMPPSSLLVFGRCRSKISVLRAGSITYAPRGFPHSL